MTVMSIVTGAIALGVEAPRAQTPAYGQSPPAQAPAMKRTVLLKEDLAMPGQELVQAIVDLPNGARSGRHTHPGEEVAYVLEGEIILAVKGNLRGRSRLGTRSSSRRAASTRRSTRVERRRRSWSPTRWRRASHSRRRPPETAPVGMSAQSTVALNPASGRVRRDRSRPCRTVPMHVRAS